MNKATPILAILVVVILAVTCAAVILNGHGNNGSNDGLPAYTIDGETDLTGNFYISFVYSKNLIMLDGKGNVVWSLHKDPDPSGNLGGCWDFKKHVIGGKTYYSYHEQDVSEDHYGINGYAPGDRVIMDSQFNEVKRIRFEESPTIPDVIWKNHPLDGHDFLLIDLDHYIMSGYVKGTVSNNPLVSGEHTVVYSYLQEVKDGNVIWEWRSVDYPELYSLTVTDAIATANDFENLVTDAPDYVHFNAMRINDDGDLICSFRHLNTIMCLDRDASMASGNQILWKLSGNADEFGLTADQKTSSQHYVTVDGDVITAFDNHNITQETRLVRYTVDTANKTVTDFKAYRIDGKFSEACGSAQYLYGETYAIGWGASKNDSVCMCVYDFSTDTQLISMTLENAQNFTYRCAYYD